MKINMVAIAQLVRASVCGTEGRGFESHWPPERKDRRNWRSFLVYRDLVTYLRELRYAGWVIELRIED
jgi:hypothetical protein